MSALILFKSLVLTTFSITTEISKGLLALIQHPNPLVCCCGLCVAVSITCWLWAFVTENCSQVDRLWSILPVFYSIIFAKRELWIILHSHSAKSCDKRLLVMFALVCTWACRLTYNFARKGGYNVDYEDYRWQVVRSWWDPLTFHAFNLIFVAFAQNAVLLLLLCPTYIAWLHTATPWNFLDTCATILFCVFLTVETVADQQQWDFQSTKHSMFLDGEELTGHYKQGFLTTGLWKYSRHPNFFGEMCLWWSFYLFSVSTAGQWLNWPLMGPVCLVMVFHGSTNLTESISLRKYPAYSQYQQTTSRWVPWFPKQSGGENKKLRTD